MFSFQQIFPKEYQECHSFVFFPFPHLITKNQEHRLGSPHQLHPHLQMMKCHQDHHPKTRGKDKNNKINSDSIRNRRMGLCKGRR